MTSPGLEAGEKFHGECPVNFPWTLDFPVPCALSLEP
jgi:hypothetical protein